MALADRYAPALLLTGTEHADSVPAALQTMGGLQRTSTEAVLPADVNQAPPRTIIVMEEALHDPRTAEVLASLSWAGVRVMRLRDYYERVLHRVKLDEVDDAWFLFDRPIRRRKRYAAVKRVLDMVAGLVGSVVVGLIAPVLWLAHRLGDHGPVFYRQERVGRAGKPFMIWKFRTMRVDAEAAGPAWATADDDRVTPIGRFLRRSRLDEMPQFFNVLAGDMSLIGPRPERPVFVRLLARAIPFYDRRHLMRPGITGWATVCFGYGDSVTDKWRSHEYDLYYLKHRSVWFDLRILAKTVVVMTLRKGQ